MITHNRCRTCGLPLRLAPMRIDHLPETDERCNFCDQVEAYLARFEDTPDLRAAAANARAWRCEALGLATIQDLPGRLSAATWSGIPQRISESLPSPVELVDLRSGDLFQGGIGLTGPAGCGKSCTLAMHARYAQRLAIDIRAWNCLKYHPEDQDPVSAPRVEWVDVPEAYSYLQALGNSGSAIREWLWRTRYADLVILDDLGAEGRVYRQAGTTPIAETTLANLIRSRNADCLPIWWSSNLNVEQLHDLYGMPLLSRLLESAPPVVLPGGMPNYRLPLN